VLLAACLSIRGHLSHANYRTAQELPIRSTTIEWNQHLNGDSAVIGRDAMRCIDAQSLFGNAG